MDKNSLLRCVAEKAYDVGIGAKKHFASYDLLEKTPGSIGFVTMAVGILGLVFDSFAVKEVNAIFIIIGTIALYCSVYDSKKNDYNEAGQAITQIFNELKTLYFTVKDLPENANLDIYENQFNELSLRFNPLCISKQVFLSNWYAHYKFFWEAQIEWIAEQRRFKLFRDKLPLSCILTLIALLCTIGVYVYKSNGMCGIQ